MQLLLKPLARVLITLPGAQPLGKVLESWQAGCSIEELQGKSSPEPPEPEVRNQGSNLLFKAFFSLLIRIRLNWEPARYQEGIRSSWTLGCWRTSRHSVGAPSSWWTFPGVGEATSSCSPLPSPPFYVWPFQFLFFFLSSHPSPPCSPTSSLLPLPIDPRFHKFTEGVPHKLRRQTC